MAILCPGSPVTTVIDVSIASPALAINTIKPKRLVGNGTVREVDGVSGFLLHFRVFWRERFIPPAKQGEMGLWPGTPPSARKHGPQTSFFHQAYSFLQKRPNAGTTESQACTNSM